MARPPRLTRWSRGPLAAATHAAVLAAAACSERAKDQVAAAPPGAWRSFEGTWSAAGERRAIEIGPDARASILDLSGSVLLTGERGLGAGFQSRALAYSDGTASSVGRAVWTDERGDKLFSELRGAPVATGREIVGTFTGGTGRWTGITGEYRFEWKYVVDADEGRVSGRVVGLRGRARIDAPGGTER